MKEIIPPQFDQYITSFRVRTKNFFDLMVRKFSLIEAFLIFNVILILGLGGVLFALRANADIYEAVRFNIVNCFFLAIFWYISLLAFAVVVRSSIVKTGLKNVGAIIVVVAAIEILAFAFGTEYIFTYIPHSRIVDDHRQINQKFKFDSQTLPKQINEFITLVGQQSKGNYVIYYYELKQRDGYAWDPSVMRDELVTNTCPYFADITQYSTVDQFVHVFMQDKKFQFSYKVTREDCLLKRHPDYKPVHPEQK